MWNSGYNSYSSGFGYTPPMYNTGMNMNMSMGGMGGYGWQYNGVWGNTQDIWLRGQIDRVYMLYDRNRNGQLEGQEFYFAYRDLCMAVGQTPPAPNDFWSIRQIAAQADTNFDGRISKMEMFNLFKRCQFNIMYM